MQGGGGQKAWSGSNEVDSADNQHPSGSQGFQLCLVLQAAQEGAQVQHLQDQGVLQQGLP